MFQRMKHAPPPPCAKLGKLILLAGLLAAVCPLHAASTSSLNWETSVEARWFTQSQTTHDGVAALQSGHISDNEVSWLQTTVVGPGTLSFWWKASSETNQDWARFSVDGVEQARISGEAGWQQATQALSAGSHALRWTYAKSGSVAAGSDAAWLDRITFCLERGTWTANVPTNWHSPIQDVFVTNGLAYLAEGTGGLEILGVSNPASLVPLGRIFSGPWAGGVRVAGHYAYVADRGNVGISGGLGILDISNPTNVVPLGWYVTGAAPQSVQVVGNHAFVTDLSRHFRILDVSNPGNVLQLGNFLTDDTPTGMHVVGNYAYVGVNQAGLQILDVHDPARITLLGGYNTSGQAGGLQAVGNRVYVADGDAGLQVLDTGDPANVVSVGNFRTSGYANSLQVVGNLAYVGNYGSGLDVLDVFNPTNVVSLGRYVPPTGWPQALQVVGNRIYLACGDGGLKIIDSFFEEPVPVARPRGFTLDYQRSASNNVLSLSVAPNSRSYYTLQWSPDLVSFTNVGMALGENAVWAYSVPAGPSVGFFRAQAHDLFDPQDSDGDGIDDRYELQHAPCLNPLNYYDASQPSCYTNGMSSYQLYLRELFGGPGVALQFFSREATVWNFGAPSAPWEAISRETTVWNFGSPSANIQAVSKEVSVYNANPGSGPPMTDINNVYSREVTTWNYGSPSARIETISMEVSVYNANPGSGPPVTDINNVYSREVSVFNFGEPTARIEAISREITVLNFQDPAQP